MTTTQPLHPAVRRAMNRAADANTLDLIREHLDREEHGGATVVRIEHVRAILGRRGR